MRGPLTLPQVDASTFGRALLDPQLDTPVGLTGPDGQTAPKRFNVYRNNVIVSLTEALGETFPAVKTLLGEEYFKALAQAFVMDHPPVSPVLIWYGAEFADFLNAFPPLEAYPYLGDVARLEWAWLQAYHAADAAPLDPAALGDVDPQRLGNVRFAPHPAAHVVTSGWPVWALARTNRFDPDGAEAVDLAEPQAVMITRPDMEVNVYLLRPGGAVFAKDLLQGHTLAEAAGRAQGDDEAFSLSDCLSDCLVAGAFSGLLWDE
ncbi:HvfC/BufC N-terminal domain-containing protein [Roseibium sp. LAB1]